MDEAKRTIEAAADQFVAAVQNIRGVALDPRSLATFKTKVDEAVMWADRAVEKGSQTGTKDI